MDSTDYCKDCRFFYRKEINPKDIRLECRSRPPRVFWNHCTEEYDSCFPDVDPESDWCGEFEPAKDRPLTSK